jgi:predicted nuclease with TOPRIM domain
VAKNVVIGVLGILLLIAICGLLFIGRKLSDAQNAVEKLAESGRQSDQLLDDSERDAERLRENNSELKRIVDELTKLEEKRRRNDQEALRILETAIRK